MNNRYRRWIEMWSNKNDRTTQSNIISHDDIYSENGRRR